MFGNLSSSALTAPIECTESVLKSQKAFYNQTVKRQRKALIIKKKLESDIAKSNIS